MIQPNRPGFWAHGDTTPTIPTFVGVEYDRESAFLRIGDKHIHLADFHTGVAADTKVRVEYDRPGGSGRIGGCVYVFP